VLGIDLVIFSYLVVKLASIRLLLFVFLAFDFEVEQMDVKTTFLYNDLEEEIYMKQHEGFAVKGKKEWVCKLKMSLYRLKQSPRMCYQEFNTYIWGFCFTSVTPSSHTYLRSSVH